MKLSEALFKVRQRYYNYVLAHRSDPVTKHRLHTDALQYALESLKN